jgi:predicted Fe-Mo cluster-binding NifX family protein
VRLKMKICVTAAASGIDAPLDPRFGRCPFFVVVNLDSMSDESIANSNINATSGAGIQAASEVAKLGASALITGNLGPNAMQTLKAANIDVYQHQGGGSVRDAVEKFKQGELSRMEEPTVLAHSGMGQGMGQGRGQGAARGGGRGQGRGQGAGRGGKQQ